MADQFTHRAISRRVSEELDIAGMQYDLAAGGFARNFYLARIEVLARCYRAGFGWK